MNNLLNTLLESAIQDNPEAYQQLLADIAIFGDCNYTIDYDESSGRIVITRIDPRSIYENNSK